MDENNIPKTAPEAEAPAQSGFENAPVAEQPYSYTPNNNYGYTAPDHTPSGSPQPPKKDKKLFGIGAMIICIVLSILVSTATSLTIAFNSMNDGKDGTESNVSSSASDLTASNTSSKDDTSSGNTISSTITVEGNIESLVEAVYDKAANSVVGIRTKAWVESFFGGSTESTGEGSGVIYTADGYIITNYHVISNVVNNQSEESAVEVFLMSAPDEPINASIIGYNVSADLAVIKVEKKNLPAIEIANSDEIKVGQYAIAIGCPGGIEFLNSVSYGIVSGLNRTITVDSIGEMDLIQTDAAINPGNSGGALLNSKGQLIGINSSKLVDESFEGMGFAIPSNTAIKVIKEIIENKDNPSPYIGIEIYKYDSEYLSQYGLPSGAAVKGVVKNAPAYNAGIRSGDIITAFNKVEIAEYTDFIDALDECKPGTKVTARIYRNGRYYSTTVTIGSNNSHG